MSTLTIPSALIDARDEISLLLPALDAHIWLAQFNEAADGDLSHVWPMFGRWLLLDAEHGVIQYAETEQQRALINNAAAGNAINCNLIFGAVARATGAGYAAAYSANPAAIHSAVYPTAYALYTAAHVAQGSATNAVIAHATTHMAAGKSSAVQAQAEQLLSLMRK